jgi:hypothetical protein
VNIKLHKYFIIRVLYGVEEFQNSWHICNYDGCILELSS